MEDSPRVSKKIKLADDGVDLDGSQLGLADCNDMDRQLAQVASATFGNVHVGLLDDIFQCVYFQDLLGIRR